MVDLDLLVSLANPHYDVLIATPGKLLHAEYVQSLVETTKWLNSEGISYKFLNKQGSLISSTRELTALDSYNQDWDATKVGSGAYTYGKIFWIDSDVEWDVTEFKKIYESPLDIVGGLYQTHPNGRVAAAFLDANGLPKAARESDFILYDEPIEMYGVGFGFIAMKSGVFENCNRPWFLMERIQWPHLPFELNVGEDYSFCINARRNGFKTFIDPTVKVKHHKETIYELR
jgi:hypothetical protein